MNEPCQTEGISLYISSQSSSFVITIFIHMNLTHKTQLYIAILLTPLSIRIYVDAVLKGATYWLYSPVIIGKRLRTSRPEKRCRGCEKLSATGPVAITDIWWQKYSQYYW